MADPAGTGLDEIKAAMASEGFGFSTGAGGVVTQLTSKSTGVTLNKYCGQITMHNANLATLTAVAFTVTNSKVATTDTVVVSIDSGATSGAYMVSVGAVGAGSFEITLFNTTAGTLGEAVVLNFAVVKAVAS